MGETIDLTVRLLAFVRRVTPRLWVATCPKIDVVSQGKSAKDAKRCLDEAVQLWFEDCLERGTLDDALRECGFRHASREEVETAQEGILVTRKSEPDILGESFPIEVTIPAYQAAAIMANA